MMQMMMVPTGIMGPPKPGDATPKKSQAVAPQSEAEGHANARSSRFLRCRTDTPCVGAHRSHRYGFRIRGRPIRLVSASFFCATARNRQLWRTPECFQRRRHRPCAGRHCMHGLGHRSALDLCVDAAICGYPQVPRRALSNRLGDLPSRDQSCACSVPSGLAVLRRNGKRGLQVALGEGLPNETSDRGELVSATLGCIASAHRRSGPQSRCASHRCRGW